MNSVSSAPETTPAQAIGFVAAVSSSVFVTLICFAAAITLLMAQPPTPSAAEGPQASEQVEARGLTAVER